MNQQEMTEFAKNNHCNDLISQVFYTHSRKFAFQRVGRGYNVYGEDGNFIKYFVSFGKMCEYIRGHDR